MKASQLKQIIREEIRKVLNTLHENFISFSDLENAIKKHEEGNDYYNETKLRNMFNQLKNNDQVKARKKYNQYFPIREEISKVINENLTITDWDEFRNPDHLLLTLSNGKQLKIAKQQIKGGRAAYESIITLLDNMESNPKAKEAMLKLVNAMASNLTRESVTLKEYDRNVQATEWAKWPNTKHGDILLSKRTGVLAVRDGNVLRPILTDVSTGGGEIVHNGAYATDKRFTAQVKPDINSIAKAYQSLWSYVTDEAAKKYAIAVDKEIKKLLKKK